MSRVDLEKIAAAARAAGEEILDIYSRDFEVELKADDSPLTEADRLANAVIMDVFATHYPEMPVISEENREVPYNQRSDWSEFWLVDPLDGTKEFVKKNGEFTVNIALVRRWTGHYIARNPVPVPSRRRPMASPKGFSMTGTIQLSMR